MFDILAASMNYMTPKIFANMYEQKHVWHIALTYVQNTSRLLRVFHVFLVPGALFTVFDCIKQH